MSSNNYIYFSPYYNELIFPSKRALELEILRISSSDTNTNTNTDNTLNGTKMTLTLIPRAGWGGRGLLGYVAPFVGSSSKLYSTISFFLHYTCKRSTHVLPYISQTDVI